jgi:hypothetical protein
MKKTNIVTNSKTKYLESYNPINFDIVKLKTFEDAVDSKTPSMNLIIRAEGETKMLALMKLWLVHLNQLLDVKRPMSETQIRLCASIIVEDFAHLKIADLGLFFRKVIKGDYGQFYESISIEKLLGQLQNYDNERFNFIEKQQFEKHERAKNQWRGF